MLFLTASAMECPHLADCVKIDSAPQKGKIDETKDWECAVCSTTLSPWLCLHCGEINCGRYVNGHAKSHSDISEGHNVCMDCVSLTVFCYSCDEFVINDTENGLLSKVRHGLCRSENNENIENEDAQSSIGDSESWKSDCSSKDTSENGRTLRPRKRSHSLDSGGTENILCKRKRDSKINNGNSRLRERKVVGLRNLGNTCFMNAVLQSLRLHYGNKIMVQSPSCICFRDSMNSNIQEFCGYFKQLPSLDAVKGNGRRVYHSRSYKEMDDVLMTEELRKVMISLNQGGTKGAISPESLFTVIWNVVPRFRGYQQQDAHEFLRYMLDRLHTELLHLLPGSTLRDSQYISLGYKGRSSIVSSVFGGTLQSEVSCLNCSMESKKHDPFLDLSLDIPDKFLISKKSKENEDSVPPCHVSDCLSSFIDVEELAESELYYCNNCKSKQRSTKRFWIRRLPNVLCLHLKRFRWNNSFRTKIDSYISFPVTSLDMSKYMITNLHETRRSGVGSNLYDLAAVIVHHGSGAGSGHYTAFAINDGQWFHFNDSTVKPTEDEVVAKSKAYILFYIRREFSLPRVNL